MTKKNYNGNLNIGKKVVSVDTDINYQAIEIKYIGTININKLLPSNYLVQSGSNKVIIIKLTHNDEILTDLFSYRGRTLITKCIIVDKELNSYNLFVNKSNLELWNTLSRTQKSGTTDGVEQDWAYITRDWEDIDYDGVNNKYKYNHIKTTYDKENRKYITTTDIRKK